MIKRWEGLRLKAYRCPAGVLTIGYGHTGEDVIPGMKITVSRAAALFDKDIAVFESGVTSIAESAGVELTQGKFDALVSFSYNLGIGALRRSTLWRKASVNPDDPTIGYEFRRWTKAGGKILPGLVKRREQEARLWED